MKTLQKRYRTWCHTCKDWTIFTMNAYSSNPIDMNLHCSICNNNILEYSILDIPKDKILEQRERYVNKEKERLLSNIGLFEMIGMDNSIKEDDAGLIKARKEEDILRKAEKERRYNLKMNNFKYKIRDIVLYSISLIALLIAGALSSMLVVPLLTTANLIYVLLYTIGIVALPFLVHCFILSLKGFIKFLFSKVSRIEVGDSSYVIEFRDKKDIHIKEVWYLYNIITKKYHRKEVEYDKPL